MALAPRSPSIARRTPGGETAALQQAQVLAMSGRFDDALGLLRGETQRRPNSAETWVMLAMVAVMAGRADEALPAAQRAATMAPGDAKALFTLGRAHKLGGDLAAAQTAYEAALQADPRHADALVSLGIVYRESGRLDEAIGSYRRALELNPQLAVAHANLAHALAAQAEIRIETGDTSTPADDLIAGFDRALAIEPNNAALHSNRGAALVRARRHEEAMQSFNIALGIEPGDVETCLRFGQCLNAIGAAGAAIALYEKWLQSNPPVAPVMRALGNILTEVGRVDEAVRWSHQALALGEDAPTLAVLGSLYMQMRRLPEGQELGRRAVALAPEQPGLHSSFLLGTNYLLEDPQAIFDAHKLYGQRLAQRASEQPGRASGWPTPAWQPGSRIKVGYVSGDFMTHSVSYFIAALLEHHDRGRFEVTCYHNRAWTDGMSERLRSHGHGWVSCAGLADGDFVRQVRSDGIHVLVDLAGHTALSRTNSLMQRPAPVQLGYLGYPTITGVQAVDFRITDTVIDAGDMPALESEVPLCLPRSMFCFRPDPAAPAVGALPAASAGFITFGSFNNVAKLSDHTLTLWAEVLKAVPGSRLLLKSQSVAERATRENIVAFMCAQGLNAERLEFLPYVASKGGHLGIYNRVDVALDTFPFNGATTTCEALWMGVPVVSMRGRTHTSRMGASILGAAGRPQWLALHDSQFVDIAAALARDRPELARWREVARDTLQTTALMDGPGFTRTFEAVLEQAWSLRQAGHGG